MKTKNQLGDPGVTPSNEDVNSLKKDFICFSTKIKNLLLFTSYVQWHGPLVATATTTIDSNLNLNDPAEQEVVHSPEGSSLSSSRTASGPDSTGPDYTEAPPRFRPPLRGETGGGSKRPGPPADHQRRPPGHPGESKGRRGYCRATESNTQWAQTTLTSSWVRRITINIIQK